MPIVRLNHAVLYVRDLQRSLDFYVGVLGFTRIEEMTPAGFSGAAFLRAPGSTNDHDLGLFAIGDSVGSSLAGRATVGL
jgi:catechol 2,3-dioxygenase-like lactoylglutathione lyase family enzyme